MSTRLIVPCTHGNMSISYGWAWYGRYARVEHGSEIVKVFRTYRPISRAYMWAVKKYPTY